MTLSAWHAEGAPRLKEGHHETELVVVALIKYIHSSPGEMHLCLVQQGQQHSTRRDHTDECRALGDDRISTV